LGLLAIISRAIFVRCDSHDHTKTSTELKSAVARAHSNGVG
jgi:hypothetical protein